MNRIGKYGSTALTAVVFCVLVACGGGVGNGSSHQVSVSGGVINVSATPTSSVAASTNPTQIQIVPANSNTPVVAILPPGESITAGTPVSLVNNNSAILQGLALPGEMKGNKRVPTTGTEGQLFIDGAYSGVTIVNGFFSSPFVLTSGQHILEAFGPYRLTSGSILNPNTLTIGKLTFGVQVSSGGISSIPTQINLLIPVNGGTLTLGNFVSVQYPNPFLTNSTTLTITDAANVSYAETLPLANGAAQYQLFHSFSRPIPSGGVASIVFEVGAH